MDKNDLKKGAILFAVLLFPSLVYVILSSGDHSFTSRPFYGPTEVTPQGDSIYYQISDFELNLCSKGTYSTADKEDQIYLISFFDANDSIASSRINGQLMTMQDRFRDNSDVTIFTISTANDSASLRMLCSFESTFPVREGKWIFGSLRNGSAEQFAIQNLKMNSSLAGANAFDSKQVILIDKNGHIRAFRDGTQYVEIKALADDVKVIKAESFIPKKIKDGEEK